MQKLLIFNPEHDLCLANGDANYVPPASALRFASQGGALMRMLYGDDCLSLDQYQGQPVEIVPWGWNKQLKNSLLKRGVDEQLMPSDTWLEQLRRLQHRSTLLPLQPHAAAARTVGEVEDLVHRLGEVVLKAPWSGSGRGIRWVSGQLSQHDVAWVNKTIDNQGCVMVERRYTVCYDFALEYRVEASAVSLVGLSLFNTQSGVYRHNILLPDSEIRSLVHLTDVEENAFSKWISITIAPHYQGPLGLDCFLTDEGHIVVGELNLRHTMGLVAHRFLQLHPEARGTLWSPPL